MCERQKLSVNVVKSKMMVAGRYVAPLSLNVQLNRETMEEVVFQVPTWEVLILTME